MRSISPVTGQDQNARVSYLLYWEWSRGDFFYDRCLCHWLYSRFLRCLASLVNGYTTSPTTDKTRATVPRMITTGTPVLNASVPFLVVDPQATRFHGKTSSTLATGSYCRKEASLIPVPCLVAVVLFGIANERTHVTGTYTTIYYSSYARPVFLCGKV